MSILLVCFSFSLRRDPSPPLFPYTTLFRSRPHSRSSVSLARPSGPSVASRRHGRNRGTEGEGSPRSEAHTSELQSRGHLVCRLLLEYKNIFFYLRNDCSYLVASFELYVTFK